MELQAVRKMAKALGVKAAGLRKLDIVRGIQKAEGNFPCFATADGYCDQWDCCFREDCPGKNY